jgi:type II secretory pathway pseudopilin PulG
MKIPISNFQSPVAGRSEALPLVSIVNRQSSIVNVSAFTMIEIAICLAIIGIALVGIIAALPIGLNTSRDNREETIIGQDANVLLELIRNGSHGADDLTNYVYAVTNYWFWTNVSAQTSGTGVNGYDFNTATVTPAAAQSVYPYYRAQPINSGSNIVSLLSTPEFTDFNGVPIASFIAGGYSNHVVAYVRSMSGLAAEKPPQRNAIMQEDSFSYRVLCVNAPLAFEVPPLWTSSAYLAGHKVYWNQAQWRAAVDTIAADVPGSSTNWMRASVFADQLAASQREIRLKFLWPQLPNGRLGANSQNFRVTVGGQLVMTNNNFTLHRLYFYQSQSFTKAP